MKLFLVKLLLRLGLIFLNMGILVWAILDPRIHINQYILSGLLIAQIIELIYFLNYTNRQLTLLMIALQHEDMTMNFPNRNLGMSFDSLTDSFQKIILDLRNRNIRNEAEFQYMEMAFDKIQTGVMTIENDDKIVLMNRTALDLLGSQRIHSLKILKNFYPLFTSSIEEASRLGTSTYEMINDNSTRLLMIHSVNVGIMEKNYRHITFHDIREELDRKEIQSWHRLIRILTHEIMNSVTPIASLAESMKGMIIRSGTVDTMDVLENEDLKLSLETIQRRSEGLLHFVEDYRRLTRIAPPILAPVNFDVLLSGVLKLLEQEIEISHARVDLQKSGDSIIMDRALIEQVVINLIKNSLEAGTSKRPLQILIHTSKSDNFKIIEISDNGVGIPTDEVKEVFVPFFTTKRNGSGIGLSLARQIMFLHRGTIKVQSEVNIGTTFRLFFPDEIIKRTG